MVSDHGSFGEFLFCNSVNDGDLHTAPKPDSLGSWLPIRILCGFAWAPHDNQTTRIALLDWISRTFSVHFHAAQRAARMWIDVVWRQSSLWILIPDPHWIRIQRSVWRARLLHRRSWLAHLRRRMRKHYNPSIPSPLTAMWMNLDS